MATEYQPADYWTRRLSSEFNLRGTGHISYSAAYNRWLYRAKRRALACALDDVPELSRALDLGSGVGWVIAELLKRGMVVEGCDIAPVAVDRLRSRFPEATVFQATLGESPLPRPDHSFDVITALDVMYHIVDDDRWSVALDDAARLLKTGGQLVVSDRFGADRDRPAPHVCFRTSDEWKVVAQGAGLELTQVIPCYRWLSRSRDSRGFARLPDGLRGVIEYGLELTVPRQPHMLCAVFRRT